MTAILSRRHFAFAASAVCIGAAPARDAVPDKIASIERLHGGRLGVFTLDTGSGRTLAHRADERFLLCSTFKGVLAALILSRVEAGQDDLASPVRYAPSDLVGHSPVTAAHVSAGTLPVGILCRAILEDSDNAAANLLMARVGGPSALTAYARRLGDAVTRFDRYELAASDRSGTLDTTTPRAIATLAQKLVLGEALRPASRDRLERWMRGNVAGRTRLRAAFPRAWTACDRTGTGDGACNDYAVARRPGHAPLVIAAYHDAPGMELAAQEAVLREVGSAVVAWAA